MESSNDNKLSEDKYGQYATLDFWENFYLNKQDPVEWYIRFADLSDILNKYITPENKILHAGAGSSSKSFIIRELKLFIYLKN